MPDMFGVAFPQVADIAARSLGTREFVVFFEWLRELREDEAFEWLNGIIQKLLPGT